MGSITLHLRTAPRADGDVIGVAVEHGAAAAIDALRPADHRAFLGSAWYEAAGATRTLVARRGDGRPVAVFPTVAAGPPGLGARAVAGSYWPFRTILADPELSARQWIGLLGDRRTRAALGPFWRMGPFFADDPVARCLLECAPAAGWTVLTRTTGTTYRADLTGNPWPSGGTAKRLRGYERNLGDVRYTHVRGAAWTPAVFDDLAAIEATSWVGETDRSGAKFINAAHERFWRAATADPRLAEMLSATILHVGTRPIAFSFDLDAGTTRHAIASSFDSVFADARPGSLVTWRALDDARARGIVTLDLGAGDSGYKERMGATAGPAIIDCLFVANPVLAALLRPRWEGALAGSDAGDDAGTLPLRSISMALLGSLATAAAASTLIE